MSFWPSNHWFTSKREHREDPEQDPDVLSETGKDDSEEIDDTNTNVLCNEHKDITIYNDKQEHKYKELLGLDPGDPDRIMSVLVVFTYWAANNWEDG